MRIINLGFVYDAKSSQVAMRMTNSESSILVQSDIPLTRSPKTLSRLNHTSLATQEFKRNQGYLVIFRSD